MAEVEEIEQEAVEIPEDYREFTRFRDATENPAAGDAPSSESAEAEQADAGQIALLHYRKAVPVLEFEQLPYA